MLNYIGCYLIMLCKLILAVVIGYSIGRERKKHEKSGGKRTFALVSLGAVIIGILSLKLLNLDTGSLDSSRYNISRLMSYGIASIGFLGSGIIIQNRKNKIEGLTTAATLWAIVPTAYFIGLGYFDIGITVSIFIYIILSSKYKWK